MPVPSILYSSPVLDLFQVLLKPGSSEKLCRLLNSHASSSAVSEIADHLLG